MPEDLLPYLADPVVWLLLALLIGLAGWITFHLTGARSRHLRSRRAALRVRAGRAATPRERHELMQQWHELGGLHERQRYERQRIAREQGQKARGAGRSLSANPFRHSLWGEGRAWKRGWKSVDRHIRWLESKRR